MGTRRAFYGFFFCSTQLTMKESLKNSLSFPVCAPQFGIKHSCWMVEMATYTTQSTRRQEDTHKPRDFRAETPQEHPLCRPVPTSRRGGTFPSPPLFVTRALPLQQLRAAPTSALGREGPALCRCEGRGGIFFYIF